MLSLPSTDLLKRPEERESQAVFLLMIREVGKPGHRKEPTDLDRDPGKSQRLASKSLMRGKEQT